MAAAGLAIYYAMYAAPLNVVRLVARTKSVEFMPLGLTVGTLACSVAWTAYALLVADLSILVPNLCGDVLGVVEVLRQHDALHGRRRYVLIQRVS